MLESAPREAFSNSSCAGAVNLVSISEDPQLLWPLPRLYDTPAPFRDTPLKAHDTAPPPTRKNRPPSPVFAHAARVLTLTHPPRLLGSTVNVLRLHASPPTATLKTWPAAPALVTEHPAKCAVQHRPLHECPAGSRNSTLTMSTCGCWQMHAAAAGACSSRRRHEQPTRRVCHATAG